MYNYSYLHIHNDLILQWIICLFYISYFLHQFSHCVLLLLPTAVVCIFLLLMSILINEQGNQNIYLISVGRQNILNSSIHHSISLRKHFQVHISLLLFAQISVFCQDIVNNIKKKLI